MRVSLSYDPLRLSSCSPDLTQGRRNAQVLHCTARRHLARPTHTHTPPLRDECTLCGITRAVDISPSLVCGASLSCGGGVSHTHTPPCFSTRVKLATQPHTQHAHTARQRAGHPSPLSLPTATSRALMKKRDAATPYSIHRHPGAAWRTKAAARRRREGSVPSAFSGQRQGAAREVPAYPLRL